jgi:para-nitrobenzyl esterase
MSKIPTLIALVTLTVVSAPPLHAAVPEPIRVETGLVSGVPGAFREVRLFKGLPFAEPPVGDLRWRPPQPPKSWNGVRAADTFSANCMQRAAGGGAFPPYGGDRSATTMSEDCLYLNVYTATASAGDRRPVMVWIHGGAYTSGAGAIYQGEDLARKGVVVVTVNYRLGVFGFLAHPELTKESSTHASGNYAFLDQIAALKWVQKNIAAFGGDPSRVTIFGESAGSWSVNNLVATPIARGLFQRAIGESGGQFSITRTLAEAEKAGTTFAEAAGASSLAALRAMPADTVNRANGFQTSATVDGWVFPQDVATIFRSGKQNDVPVIIGSNANEGSIFTPETTTGQSFRAQSQRRYGAETDAFLKLYPFTSDQEARAAQAASMRDQTFGWEMRTWARLQTATGKSKVYLYYFSRVPPIANAAWLGAQHGSEIPYAFNWPNGQHSTQVPWTDTDRTLADQVSSYWVNFATTGDPNGKLNGKDLPKWAPYQTRDDQAMGISAAPGMIPVPNTGALDFLDGYAKRAQPSPVSRPSAGR